MLSFTSRRREFPFLPQIAKFRTECLHNVAGELILSYRRILVTSEVRRQRLEFAI